MMQKLIFLFILFLGIFSANILFAQTKDSGLVTKDTRGVVLTTSAVDFKLSGGIYLYDYAPLIKGVNNNFDVYAYILNTDANTKDDKFGLHVETRIRDTKLRSFYTSTIWLQEAYAYYHNKYGNLHVGKFYNKVGILWDGSFYGNVQYFNGLKLNPEFGAEWVGTNKIGHKNNVLDYSVQLISNNSGTNGALPGRDVQSDTNSRFKNGITARIAPTFQISKNFSITPGVSALTGTLKRINGGNFHMAQLDGELTLNIYNGAIFGEVLYLDGERNDINHPYSRPGYDHATYLFAGTRYTFFKKLTARVSYSQANYEGSNSVERELLPGLVYSFNNNLALIAEYNYWDLTAQSASHSLIDNSLNFVVHFAF